MIYCARDPVSNPLPLLSMVGLMGNVQPVLLINWRSFTNPRCYYIKGMTLDIILGEGGQTNCDTGNLVGVAQIECNNIG